MLKDSWGIVSGLLSYGGPGGGRRAGGQQRKVPASAVLPWMGNSLPQTVVVCHGLGNRN